MTLEFKYPSLDVESEIVQAVSGVEKKIADKLCRLAMVVREQPELGFNGNGFYPFTGSCRRAH